MRQRVSAALATAALGGLSSSSGRRASRAARLSRWLFLRSRDCVIRPATTEATPERKLSSSAQKASVSLRASTSVMRLGSRPSARRPWPWSWPIEARLCVEATMKRGPLSGNDTRRAVRKPRAEGRSSAEAAWISCTLASERPWRGRCLSRSGSPKEKKRPDPDWGRGAASHWRKSSSLAGFRGRTPIWEELVVGAKNIRSFIEHKKNKNNTEDFYPSPLLSFWNQSPSYCTA